MKKTLFAALALAFVASCSNEEVVEMAQKEAIGFDNAFVNNPTRSFVDPTITTNSLTDFSVYAFVQGNGQAEIAPLFDNEKVAKEGITNSDLTNAWKYAGTQYWIAEAKYNFCAIAPYSGNWEKTTCAVEETTLKTVLDFTNNGTTDLLYAVAKQYTGKKSSNDDVAFDFKHILSKVKFSFQNDYNADNATVKVHDVKINNPHKTGTVTLTHDANGAITTVWSAQANTTEGSKLTLDFGDATSAKTSTEADAFVVNKTLESHKELLLIPGAATETKGYNVTFTVELLINNKTITTYNHNVDINLTLEWGKCYNILAKINAKNINPEQAQEPIEFTAKISDWDTTKESQEITLPTIETPATGN